MPTSFETTRTEDYDDAFELEWTRSSVPFDGLTHLNSGALVQRSAPQALGVAAQDSSIVASDSERQTIQLENSQMHNSGNKFRIQVVNHFHSVSNSPSDSSSSTNSSRATTHSQPGSPPRSATPTTPSASMASSRHCRRSPSIISQIVDHGSTNQYSSFTMEREKGCYVEPVTPLRKNIPFHHDTPPHVKAYMSSSFEFADTLIPLWKPRHRQFPTGMTNIGMIGDVGYLDAEGAFKSLFNIFLTREDNERYGYSPPTNFEGYSNFEVREGIIAARPVEPNERLAEGSVRWAVSGKLRLTESTGPAVMSFRSEALASDDPHGSVVVFHKAIYGELDDRHPPARPEYIQPYLNRNAADWYTYYNVTLPRRPPLKNGQLMLVHTSWSTDSWASAAFARENDWERGKYFANLIPHSSGHRDVYAWTMHSSVRTKSLNPKPNAKLERSDYCIAIGANSILLGDPPGHTRDHMKRTMNSISQRLSAMRIRPLSKVTFSARSLVKWRTKQ